MDDPNRETVERLHALFLNCSDPDRRERPDGWSVREVAGHLLDSVSNNHQRLSRYIPNGNLVFPAYDQNLFVARAGYASFDYRALVSLWYQYNLLFFHMAAQIPAEMLHTSTVTVGDRPMVSYGQLIEDYFAHMERHERQVKRILDI